MSTLQEQLDSFEWEVRPTNLIKEAVREYNVARLRETYSDEYLLETRMVRPEELRDTS
ncbi:MAG: hypothetical protein AABW80_05375 [Nanoarchaeota archaeon]